MLRLYSFLGALLPLVAGEQPSAPKPVAAPMRDLPWGQLNFLQTTDTHGWFAGHLQEAQYSADWGDYISFAARLREQADAKGVDLLLVDCGDRVEGNGLYDASDPKGKYTYDIIKQQNIDVITTGNHELYMGDTAAREYNYTVPNFHGNYLASNLDYLIPGTGERVAMAQRCRKFTTKNLGIRVVAFGFLFDFTGNSNNTFVQPVAKTIQEEWFQEAIREKADLFLVAGHVTLNGPEYNAIYNAIRKQNWDTPIQFFGGHSHIRNFVQYDSKASGVQAGRYLETIGWLSIDGFPGEKDISEPNLDSKSAASFTFKRRYIDNNLFGYHYHTGLNDTTFPTEHGKNVSRTIRHARKSLNLDHNFGCAPKDLWLNRAPYPSDDSLLTWLEKEVLPDIAVIEDRKDMPRLAITNSGALRFDIFKGSFTIDTTYIISPFVSKFRYIKDVRYESARRLSSLINQGGPVLADFNLSTSQLAPPEQLSSELFQDVTNLPEKDMFSASGTQNVLHSRKPDLVPGYTTKDQAGDDGDDTVHSPIQFYRIPNVIEAALSFPKDDEPEKVDVIFIDFIQPWIIMALKFLGEDYGSDDTLAYRDDTFTDLLKGWIENNWGKDC